MHILLICDDDFETALLNRAFKYVDIQMSEVNSIEKALKFWEEHPASLIILSEKTKNHLLQITKLREFAVVPILLITERLTEQEQISFWQKGGDIYIPRPYNSKLLVFQVQALLKYTDTLPLDVISNLKHEDFHLKPQTKTVVIHEESTELTNLEFRLLYLLASNNGQVFTSDQLVEKIWGYSDNGSRELLRKLVHRLRKKIDKTRVSDSYIRTVSNIGYTFQIK